MQVSAAPALRPRLGWPGPPPLTAGWMARRAAFWLRLMQNGRVDRFHADLTALTRHGRARRHAMLFHYGETLRQEWRVRAEAGPAGPALIRADHPNYLGSPAVVHSLVDGYIALLIARAGGTAPFSACEVEMRRLARVFAGIEPGYAPIGGWNTRGQLGDTAIRRVPLAAAETLPLDAVLMETFAAIGLAAFRILRAAEGQSIGPDRALSRLSDLAGFTVALLLGTIDSQPDTATLLTLVADVPDPVR